MNKHLKNKLKKKYIVVFWSKVIAFGWILELILISLYGAEGRSQGFTQVSFCCAILYHELNLCNSVSLDFKSGRLEIRLLEKGTMVYAWKNSFEIWESLTDNNLFRSLKERKGRIKIKGEVKMSLKRWVEEKIKGV